MTSGFEVEDENRPLVASWCDPYRQLWIDYVLKTGVVTRLEWRDVIFYDVDLGIADEDWQEVLAEQIKGTELEDKLFYQTEKKEDV